MMRRAAVLCLLASALACRSTPAPLPTAAPAPPPRATPPTAPPAATDDNAIRWVRDAAEYHAALRQVYRQATARVEQEAGSRARGTWAVVLDADETVVSNVTYQIERARDRLAFSPESWRAWVQRREATPLPGAAAFLSRVRALGGRIAIVTNRLQSECADTEAVFAAHALVYDAMLCRPDGGPSDKNPRFDAVRAGTTPAASSPLDIVAFVGDNILDFPRLSQAIRSGGDPEFSEFGVRFFIVPNPMYGSWQPR